MTTPRVHQTGATRVLSFVVDGAQPWRGMVPAEVVLTIGGGEVRVLMTGREIVDGIEFGGPEISTEFVYRGQPGAPEWFRRIAARATRHSTAEANVAVIR